MNADGTVTENMKDLSIDNGGKNRRASNREEGASAAATANEKSYEISAQDK
jgi:hypothetical protein